MALSSLIATLLDVFILFTIPVFVLFILVVYCYRATKHDNIPTLREGYNHIIGHSYCYHKHLFINNNEHDWIYNTLKETKSKLLCLSFPFNTKHILINDIKVCQYLFSEKENDLFTSRKHCNSYRDLLGSSILNSNGDQHKVHKTKSSPFFTQNMSHFNSIFTADAKLMISKVDNNEYHDINELLLRCCLASFCRIYIGTDLNLIKSYPNVHPFLNAYNQTLYYANGRRYKSFWKILRYFNVGSERVIKSGIQLMDSILATLCEAKKGKIDKIKELNTKLKTAKAQNKLKKHSQEAQKKYMKMKSKSVDDNDNNMDLLDKMQHISMDANVAQNNLIDFYLLNNEDVELQQLRDDIMNYLYASRDHLALWIAWFFYEITLDENKKIYQEVIKEVESIACKYNVNKLKYLEFCLFETLRLHPIKPWIIKQCMRNVKVPQTKYQINKNDCIAIHNYSLCRSKKLWPNQPNVFKPNRWKKTNKKKKNVLLQSIFFGINSRECMGKKLAINAAKIYIFNILKDYDIIAKPQQKITYAPMSVLHMKHGLYIKFIKR